MSFSEFCRSGRSGALNKTSFTSCQVCYMAGPQPGQRSKRRVVVVAPVMHVLVPHSISISAPIARTTVPSTIIYS